MKPFVQPWRWFLASLALLSLLSANARAAADKPAGPPNILFAIADDWGCHASAYGTKWIQTPNFDRVAREGLLFTHTFTPNAKCAPSRACIITGRNSWQLKDAANHICYFPMEFKSWGEALTENGWFVGHTTKGWGPGVATNALGKARLLTGQAFNAKRLKPPTTGIGTSDYAANFEDFLNAAPKDKPWCFWYGSIEPHRPYEFGSGVAKGGRKVTDIDRVPAYWPDNEIVRNDMLDYAYEVEYFDKHLGRMLESLEKRGLLENTLVIVTSDHGMPFPRGKGSAYEASNHVPFAARWPRGIVKPGRTVDDYVSFVDLAPTFIELAGLKWSQTGMAPTVGRSLTEIFRSPKSGRIIAARDHVLIGKERHDIGRPDDVGYPIRGIIKNDQLFLQNFEPDRWPACNPETGYLNVDAGPTKTLILENHRANPSDQPWALAFGKRPGEEFYDLTKDPDCMRNLAFDPNAAKQREQLKLEMYTQLKEQQDPRMDGHGDVFDKYLHANPDHVHFYERYMKGEKLKTPWALDSDYEKKPLE